MSNRRERELSWYALVYYPKENTLAVPLRRRCSCEDEGRQRVALREDRLWLHGSESKSRPRLTGTGALYVRAIVPGSFIVVVVRRFGFVALIVGVL